MKPSQKSTENTSIILQNGGTENVLKLQRIGRNYSKNKKLYSTNEILLSVRILQPHLSTCLDTNL